MNPLFAFVDWIRRNWFILKWPVAVLILAYLFYTHRDGFQTIAEQRIQWGYFAAAFVVFAISTLLTFGRWYLLVRGVELPFRLKDAIRLGLLGFLFNYVAPGATGGDIVKAIMIVRKQTSRRTVAAATVVLDRIVGMIALFLVAAVVSLIEWPLVQKDDQLKVVAATFWIGSIVGLAGLAAMLMPVITGSSWLKRIMQWKHVGKFVEEIVDSVSLYQANPKVIAATLGISVVSHIGILSSFYLCALALHGEVWHPDYLAHLIVIPTAEVASAVVPLPGGLGALEPTIGYFYAVVAKAQDVAVSPEVAAGAGFYTGMAYRVLTIALAAIGGLYYFSSRKEIDEVLEETHERDLLSMTDVHSPGA